MKKANTSHDRRRYVVERVADGDAILISDMMSQFKCSRGTVYHDLKYLRGLGFDVYTRRGIISTRKTRRVNRVQEIKFPSRYKEAGVAILSYFARILEQKYPNTDASVSIIQHGPKVTLKIESDEGDVETVEKALSEYGAVVLGRLSPEDLLPVPVEALELKNRLEITQMELRMKEEVFVLQHEATSQRIESLEGQLSELRIMVGTQLSTVQTLSDAITQMATAERVSPSVARALDTIASLLSVEHSDKNESELRNAVETIRQADEDLFQRVRVSVSSIGHSIMANFATPWVQGVINSFP